MLNCVIDVVFDLISLDQTLHQLNTTTVHNIATLFTVLALAFIFCYYADRVTVDLLEVSDIFYNSLWYKLPFQEQQLLILPIRRAQKKFRLKGYTVFECSIEVFVKVCRYHFKLLDKFVV